MLIVGGDFNLALTCVHRTPPQGSLLYLIESYEQLKNYLETYPYMMRGSLYTPTPKILPFSHLHTTDTQG